MVRHNGEHHDRPVTVSPRAPEPGDRSWWQVFRSWPVWARVPMYVAVGLVLVLVVGLVTGVVLVRRPLPQTDGELDLPGPDAARSRWSATSTASRRSTATPSTT